MSRVGLVSSVFATRRRVHELVAKQAITDVLYAYCHGLDRMDEDLARSVFHDDSRVEYSRAFSGSGHGFIDWVFEVHRDMRAHSHQITNILIHLHGDARSAVSESYVTVHLHRPTLTEGLVDIVILSRYLDEWSKRDGRWAINRRQCVRDLADVLPVTDPGPVSALGPDVPVLASRRDRTDVSYSVVFEPR
jgi:hypothetical protein